MAIRNFAFAIIASSVFIAPCVFANRALADEQVRPLAISGDWVALSHSESMLAAPDMCLAVQRGENISFVIRADENDVEIRLLDTHWSLPAGVTGKIHISVDKKSYDLDIGDNTSNMVMATISKETLQSLIGAMNNSGSMTVTPGDSAPQIVSLNGSNKVTTAFLTCAGIRAKGEGAGSDPFK